MNRLRFARSRGQMQRVIVKGAAENVRRPSFFFTVQGSSHIRSYPGQTFLINPIQWTVCSS